MCRYVCLILNVCKKCIDNSLRNISLEIVVCPKKDTGFGVKQTRSLLGAGVLGDSLGALRHGVLGQFTGEEQTDSSLDLPGGDGGATVVVSQAGSLSCNTLEDVIHERVHDRHGLAGDTGVRVHLLQHFVDVDGVRLLPPPFALLVTGSLGLGLGGGLLGSLAGCFGRHVYSVAVCCRMVAQARGSYL